MGCSPLGSYVHGISQARGLEWVPISSSRGSSPTRDQTRVSNIVCSKSLQWCLNLCDSMSLSPPRSSIHGMLQTKILEWVAISFSWMEEEKREKGRQCFKNLRIKQAKNEFLFSRLQDRMICLVYRDLAGPVSFCDFRYGGYCKTAKVISVFCFIFSSLISTLPESPSEGGLGIWSPPSRHITDSRVSSMPRGPHPAWAPQHWERPPVWGLCTGQRQSRGISGLKRSITGELIQIPRLKWKMRL